MGLGVAEEHLALAESVRGWAERTQVTAQARASYDTAEDTLPESWAALASQGLLGLAVAEDYGGSGAGLVEQAVALSELGRALAPGPIASTAVVGWLVQRHGDEATKRELLVRIADGSKPCGVLVPGTALVLGGAAVRLIALPVDSAGWAVVDAANCTRTSTPGMDPSRRVARVQVQDAEAAWQLPGLGDDEVRDLLAVALAAEAAGLAVWCLDTAVAYAKVREQFGKPIGSFQAVKHRCADMLAEVELANAAAWDAAGAADDDDARPLAAAVAAEVCFNAAVWCAKQCIQLHGGIGYTWEHDAHLYLKRALSLRQLLGGSDVWRPRACRLALAGSRRARHVELPAEAERHRREVREFLATLDGVNDPAERRQRIADAGYLVPHWPKPYGRDAGPVEQLVVAEEFTAAEVDRPDLIIGAWALPPILQYGTDAQRERFVRPTLYGDIRWCQMFSEPGAGSDLASLQTKAVRVEGGWSLSGQKVWTSTARTAHWGFCLARTSNEAKRHQGITFFLVDMTSPGLDVRPLRELTGEALFNEIFFNDVFVPDECVVGEVGAGWRLARTSLANERVAMSSGSAFPSGVAEVLAAVHEHGLSDDDVTLYRAGELVCRAQADALLGVRATLASISGTDPGPVSSVRKLVGMHLRQDAAELTLELAGPGATAEGESAAYRKFLGTRQLTIAGGTSEVQHNVIAERILGLPRE